jgi:hypothetical protein
LHKEQPTRGEGELGSRRKDQTRLGEDQTVLGENKNQTRLEEEQNQARQCVDEITRRTSLQVE